MQLMIVDDNQKMRQVIKEMLSDDFNGFTECSSGREAVEKYNIIKPDWIIMDIKMKEMNGIEAAAQITRNNPEARIIIITNYNDNNLQIAALKAGAIKYFQKENLNAMPAFIRNFKN